jgi:hypothetical protein
MAFIQAYQPKPKDKINDKDEFTLEPIQDSLI